MNTIKVRPVLLPTKDKHSQLEIDDLSVGKLSYESKLYQCKNPMKFVLISLGNDKIKAGDIGFINIGGGTIGVISYDEKYETWDLTTSDGIHYPFKTREYIKKVVATQDQLSPELIQQLITEYNNSCMQDFEIEMEEDKSNLCDCYYTKYCKSTQLAPGVKCRDIKHYKPKLNNGFVCITKKEPILYTEEEVLNMLDKYDEAKWGCPARKGIEEITFWFNQNKKK